MADLKISQLTNYTTPLNADLTVIVDTANTSTKKTTWANIKATLKTYFDTLYPSGAGTFSGTSSGTNTGDQVLPVKASGAELDTGTDDAKFATAKALKDSHNVPSVVPSTLGNVLTSNGTDWTSASPGATSSQMWAFNQQAAHNAATTYYMPLGTYPSALTVEAKYLITKNATISKLYINAVTNTLDGNSVFTVRKNGSDQTLTATLASTVLTGNDTTHSFGVVAGDLISVKLAIAGSSGELRNGVSASFEIL